MALLLVLDLILYADAVRLVPLTGLSVLSLRAIFCRSLALPQEGKTYSQQYFPFAANLRTGRKGTGDILRLLHRWLYGIVCCREPVHDIVEPETTFGFIHSRENRTRKIFPRAIGRAVPGGALCGS